MTDPDSLARASAAGLGRLFAAGAADPVEVTELFLERIAATRDEAVYLAVTPERARGEAAASRARYREGRALGPLDGVPIAWKDLFDIVGTRTTGGSAILAERPPAERDAPVVAHLAAAGMVCLGKVNTPELAFSGIGLNPHFGTPINPHDKSVARAPGGSSCGSAVAVARNLCPCSIGSDTGGSVRVPAAFNGITGFKSSEGRIDKTGAVALSVTLDTVGPLCKTVEDAILLDMALCGQLTTTVRRADLAGVHIVVPTTVALDELEDAVGANFEAALDRLSQAGASVERRAMPLYDEFRALVAAHGTIAAAESYYLYKDMLDGPNRERMDRRVAERVLAGKRMSAVDWLAIADARTRMNAEFRAQVGDSLLAMPTTPITAPKIAPLEADDNLFHAVNLKTLKNTMLGNFLATCGLALPSGRDAKGLPTSILISAPAGADEALLSYGLGIERALGEMAAPALVSA